MANLVPDHISAIEPYIPGKPSEELEREYGITNSIKLASNENPLGPSENVIKTLTEAIKKINFYPDGNAYYLRKKLSGKFNVDMKRIICGSGSVEIIEMIPRTFLDYDENVVTSSMTFPSYKISTLMVNKNFREAPVKNFGYDLDAFLDLIDEKTKIIFIANPNNPTGTMIKRKELEAFMAKLPAHPILVLDEAYFEFIDDPDYPNGLDYLDQRERIMIMRTFSKIHGIAGLRVGYAFSSKEIIAAMNKVRSPFNVNSLAQAAAATAIDDEEHVKKTRENNRKGLKYLSEEFNRLGLKYISSYGNFILALPQKSAIEIDESLKRRGIITRLGGDGKALRISIGTPEQNKKLITALEELL